MFPPPRRHRLSFQGARCWDRFPNGSGVLSAMEGEFGKAELSCLTSYRKLTIKPKTVQRPIKFSISSSQTKPAALVSECVPIGFSPSCCLAMIDCVIYLFVLLQQCVPLLLLLCVCMCVCVAGLTGWLIIGMGGRGRWWVEVEVGVGWHSAPHQKRERKKKNHFKGFLLPLPFGRITQLPEIHLHGGTKL